MRFRRTPPPAAAESKGVRAGVALKPATPLYELDYILDQCDAVLLMLINPGFAQVKGEAQTPYAPKKVHDLHKMIQGRNANTKIILDGRISPEDIQNYGTSGEANIFVAGSTCIRKEDQAGSLKQLKSAEDELNKIGKR